MFATRYRATRLTVFRFRGLAAGWSGAGLMQRVKHRLRRTIMNENVAARAGHVRTSRAGDRDEAEPVRRGEVGWGPRGKVLVDAASRVPFFVALETGSTRGSIFIVTLQRHDCLQGHDCAVVAPSLIPLKTRANRIKTDQRDAEQPCQAARRAGEPAPVLECRIRPTKRSVMSSVRGRRRCALCARPASNCRFPAAARPPLPAGRPGHNCIDGGWQTSSSSKLRIISCWKIASPPSARRRQLTRPSGGHISLARVAASPHSAPVPDCLPRSTAFGAAHRRPANRNAARDRFVADTGACMRRPAGSAPA